MKDRVLQFLSGKLMGRALHTDTVSYELDGGTLEGVYSDIMTFSDLTDAGATLSFNLTTVSHEIMYQKTVSGERGRVEKDYTGVSVFHYVLAQRKSTGDITGFMQLMSSTVKDGTMGAVVCGVHDVCLQEGQLFWKEKQLFYRDSPLGNGNFKPVAFDADIRFYHEQGKLIFEYLPHVMDVDPETMMKSISPDIYPPYISKEK